MDHCLVPPFCLLYVQSSAGQIKKLTRLHKPTPHCHQISTSWQGDGKKTMHPGSQVGMACQTYHFRLYQLHLSGQLGCKTVANAQYSTGGSGTHIGGGILGHQRLSKHQLQPLKVCLLYVKPCTKKQLKENVKGTKVILFISVALYSLGGLKQTICLKKPMKAKQSVNAVKADAEEIQHVEIKPVAKAKSPGYLSSTSKNGSNKWAAEHLPSVWVIGLLTTAKTYQGKSKDGSG